MTEPAAPPDPRGPYEQALEELKSPRPVPVSSLLFVILMLVFVVGAFTNLRSVTGVLLLVATVLVHEAGHALGMRLFGFRDVRMFFIPFFGAAVSGRARGAAAWKEAMVSLLGPLPGLLAGVALVFWSASRPHPVALPFRIAEVLLVLNGFNLLPLGFLDGGRFLDRVLFSRHRVLEVAAQAVGYLLLGLLAVRAGMWVLGFFVLISLAGLPARWRTLSAAAQLRRLHPGLPSDPDRLDEAGGRAVFDAARAVLGTPAHGNARDVARVMEALLDAVKRGPGVLATIGLLVVYGFGLLCAVVGLLALSVHLGPVEWTTVERPAWRAEFPRPPLAGPDAFGPQAPRDSSWRTVLEGTERFTLLVLEGAGDGAWMDSAAADLARRTRTTLAARRPASLAGHAAVDFEFTAPGRVLRARMLAAGSWRYELTASAPAWGPNQRRFVDAFTLRDTASTP